jgi:hypothetical protein
VSVGGDFDILRLNITVDDRWVLFVQIADRITYLHNIGQSLRFGERPTMLFDNFPQILALNIIHHQILLSLKAKMMNHTGQPWVAQPGQNQGLLLELVDTLGRLEEIFFNRHRHIEVLVKPAIDGSHPSVGQQTVNPIPFFQNSVFR